MNFSVTSGAVFLMEVEKFKIDVIANFHMRLASLNLKNLTLICIYIISEYRKFSKRILYSQSDQLQWNCVAQQYFVTLALYTFGHR